MIIMSISTIQTPRPKVELDEVECKKKLIIDMPYKLRAQFSSSKLNHAKCYRFYVTVHQ